MTLEDYQNIISDIKFDYSKDNYFTELKRHEIEETRINLARNFQDMVGKYYSHDWVRRNILQQTDEEIELMDSQINKENNSQQPRWLNPQIEANIQMLQQQDMMDQQAEQAQQQQQDQSLNNPQLDSSQQDDPEIREKLQQVRNAQVIVDQMKKKKGNRSMQDESKFKAAVQIIAKNKDLLGQMGTGPMLPKTHN